MSDSLWPHGLYSAWNSPGQNTEVGSLSFLQRIFPTQASRIAGGFFTNWATREAQYGACVCAKSLELSQTLCDLMDCNLPGSTVHGFLQAGILEWVATPSSRGSSHHRDQTHDSSVSHTGRRVFFFFLMPLEPPGKPSSYHYLTTKDLALLKLLKNYCPFLTLEDIFFCFRDAGCTLPAWCDSPQNIHQVLYFFWTNPYSQGNRQGLGMQLPKSHWS